MPRDKQEMPRIAQAIERYLLKHSSAADSLENVTKWWLGHQRYHDTLEEVQRALDYLVDKGRVVRTKNTDGTYIYQKQQ